MSTREECFKAVFESVKWLDKNKPSWYARVNPDYPVAKQLGLTEDERRATAGFNSKLPAGELKDLWKIFIEKRMSCVIPRVVSMEASCS
jgi:hypothetical protein